MAKKTTAAQRKKDAKKAPTIQRAARKLTGIKNRNKKALNYK